MRGLVGTLVSDLRACRVPLLLGVLFLGLCTWWVFYVPYAPQRLYAVIPGNATFVSSHEQAGARWVDALSNPALRLALLSAGGDPAEIERSVRDPRARVWLERVTKARTVVAYIERFGRFNREALVFASWVGRDARKLQWSADAGLIPGLRRAIDGSHLPFYYVGGVGPGGARLSLAIVDGMLLGYYGVDAHGLGYLLRRATPGADEKPIRFDWLPEDALDRVTMKVPHPFVDRAPRTRVQVDLGAFRDRHASLRAYADAAWPSGRLLSGDDRQFVRRLLGDRPEAFVAIPGPQAFYMMPQRESAIWRHIWHPLSVLSELPDRQAAFAALLGGDDSARIGRGMAVTLGVGMRVPVFVLGVRVDEGSEHDMGMSAAVRRFNALYRAKLSIEPFASEGVPMQIIVGHEDDFYGDLRPEECFAYARIDNWLVAASSAEALSRVLRRYASPVSMTAMPRRSWMDAVRPESAGALWVDHARVEDSTRALVALYTLFLPRDEAGQLRRQAIRDRMAAFQSLAPLKTLRVSALRAEGEPLLLDLELGSAPDQ